MLGIEEGRCGAVTVLHLRGEATDVEASVRIAHELIDRRVDGGHLVLDLTDLVVTDPSAVCALFARLATASGAVPIPTAVADASTRQLLRACGSGVAGLALFPSVEEACDVARPALTPT